MCTHLIFKNMKIITTREMRADTKAFFELAEKERVAVKRGRKYVNLVVTNEPDSKFVSEEWLNEFFSIPSEYRCNPFDVSASGDLFFADKRNIDKLNKSIQEAKEGKTKKIKTKKELNTFLESL